MDEPRTLQISVLVPVFGAVGALRSCLESLAAHLPKGCDVHVLDDATPGDDIATAVGKFAELIPRLTYTRREANVGYLGNCNLAIAELLDTGRDILLLNSDTRITAGAVEEMFDVLYIHEKHGVVSPRSDNATIFSIPTSERLEASLSFDLWGRVRFLLPRYHIVPTCVGFCMLVRNAMFRHFGMFDPVYNPGYNEENDFIRRINRHGFSAIAANRAFVFHEGSASFGECRDAFEARHRAELDVRYPEYTRVISEYVNYSMDPVDRFTVLWNRSRPRLLFDLEGFPPQHSGSSEFAFSLLLHLAPLLEAHCDVVVKLNSDTREFFASEIEGYAVFQQGSARHAPFDLVFRPAQIFSAPDLYRMARLGARLCYTHQDSIAVRCQYLSGPALSELHRVLPGLVDCAVVISDASRSDYEALHQLTPPFRVIHQGTHPAPREPVPKDGYILVMGNRFHHKGVEQAVEALRGFRAITVLGGAPLREPPPGVRWLVSGSQDHVTMADLLVSAAVVVYPSYYEGFGLPVLDSLAIGRPVIVIESDINRELRDLAQWNPNLHIVPTHAHLRSAVMAALESTPATGATYRTWSDVATDYDSLFRELLATPLNPERLRERWRWLTAIEAGAGVQ